MELDAPIITETLAATIRCAKPSAAGPDGIGIGHIKRIDTRQLCALFNGMLLHGYIPRSLKQARTILIPKSADNRENINNWRPITVTSMLLRLLNRMLVKSLTEVWLSTLQKGFRVIDGCLANNALLQLIIKQRRKLCQPYSIISLDLRKAFDRVSHNSISRCLKRLNISPHFAKFIMANYTEATTKIECGKSTTCKIPINRGVKQGDPRSPLLFNMIMDEFLCSIPESAGIQLGNRRVLALAYADDILLLAKCQSGVRQLLKMFETFCFSRGLDINAAKCAAMVVEVVPKKKKLFSTPCFYIYGEPISSIGINHFRYLGAEFSPMGLNNPKTEVSRAEADRIIKSASKP